MAKSNKQVAQSLITFYSNCHLKRFGKKPAINRYSEVWGMSDLLLDYSEEEIKEIIEYFFRLDRSSHSTKNLYANFTKLIDGKKESESLREERRKLLKRTKEIVDAEENIG